MSKKQVRKALSYFEKYFDENAPDLQFRFKERKHPKGLFFSLPNTTESLLGYLSPSQLSVFAMHNDRCLDILFDTEISIKKIGRKFQCTHPTCLDTCKRNTAYEVWADHIFADFHEWLDDLLKPDNFLVLTELECGSSWVEIRSFKNQSSLEEYCNQGREGKTIRIYE